MTERPDNSDLKTCTWVGGDPLYIEYHDKEWGVAEYDSRALWEKLALDGFQAGLSWLTILKKREAFRAAFAGFNPERVARFDEGDINRLLQDAGIVRHLGKITATIAGAQAWLAIEEAQGFDNFLWDFVGGAPIVNHWRTQAEVPTQDALSEKISKALKAKGFTFCGPTIVYAFMEASGLINNHLIGCPRHKEVQEFTRTR